MNLLIKQAISEKKLLSVYYGPGYRTVEPCAYGAGTDGQHLLRAFQTSGASASGEHVNWKLFRVDRLRQISILDRSFLGGRPDYRRNDRAMTRGIFCQI